MEEWTTEWWLQDLGYTGGELVIEKTATNPPPQNEQNYKAFVGTLFVSYWLFLVLGNFQETVWRKKITATFLEISKSLEH